MSAAALSEALQQVPSFRDFMEGVASDIVGGRHVLLLTGGQVGAPQLRAGLEGALARSQGPLLRSVALAEQFENEAPSVFLSRVTGLPEEQLRPASRPMETGGFQTVYDVLWLEGVEGLSPARAKAWLEFFRLSTRYAAASSHAFVMPLRRMMVPLQDITSDTRLALHWWWGRLSGLELRLMCRLVTRESLLSPESVWREAVLPHVVDGNVGLAAKLWDVVLEPEATLLDALRRKAREQGLEPSALREVLRRLGRPKAERSAGDLPPAAWRPLWEMGAAWHNVEHGPELTVLALAALEDLPAVRNRLWRGQSALLMPRLNRVRMEVCRALTEKHGRSWPTRFGAAFMDEEQRRRVEEDPLSTEHGPLENILYRRPDVGGQRFLPLVQLSRQMRNLLAHDEIVSFGDFRSLWEMQDGLALG
ncbi:MAG TPA: hypothetical protein VFZ09_09675 [Archangium sp.]|uniref:hypothetical protein n=1 Tax=Archangium sp. TaxID=1872627 RepID=UPI002E356ABA|nr:hypothetical protein [Archangium sp.]HEX5746502.1 hypothetical protein [Archangium sp.]